MDGPSHLSNAMQRPRVLQGEHKQVLITLIALRGTGSDEKRLQVARKCCVVLLATEGHQQCRCYEWGGVQMEELCQQVNLQVTASS